MTTTGGGATQTTAGRTRTGTATVTISNERFEFILRDVASGVCSHLDTGFTVTDGRDSQGVVLDIHVAPDGWQDPDPDEFTFQKPKIVVTDATNNKQWYAGGLMEGDIPHVFQRHSGMEATIRGPRNASGTALFIESTAEIARYLEWTADQSQPMPDPEVLTGSWELNCPD